VLNVFGRTRKGKKSKVIKHLAGNGELELTYLVAPETKTLFFLGIWHRRNGLRLDFSGFVFHGGKKRSYGGNLITAENALTPREERLLLQTIMAGTNWNGFNRNSFKE
jgi:hypothetical protein